MDIMFRRKSIKWKFMSQIRRGKPLGLGSVKVCIINQTERKLSPEYHLEIENNLEKLGECYINNINR